MTKRWYTELIKKIAVGLVDIKRTQKIIILILALAITVTVMVFALTSSQDGGYDPSTADAATAGPEVSKPIDTADTAPPTPVIPPIPPEPEPPTIEDTHDLVDLSGYKIDQGGLILLNYENEYTFSEELSLISVAEVLTESYSVERDNILVSESIVGPMNDFFDAFTEATGRTNIVVISGHRTLEYQQLILDGKAEIVGLTEALRWVAQPGKSEHHTGLAIDIGLYNSKGVIYTFTGEGVYSWLAENAYKFGFILRYPYSKTSITSTAYEPWHFRYLGIPHAYKVTELGMSYDEYIEYIAGFTVDEPLFFEYDGMSYEVFCTTDSAVYIEKDAQWSVSGNNVDALIVTVERDATAPGLPSVGIADAQG